jgi:hypothetical protein
MTRYLQLKFALAGIGIVVLLWGLRVDDSMFRWIGIAFLAASVLTRFLPKRLRAEDYPDKPEA